MWGCITWEEVGYACKIDGRMDGDLSRQMLDDKLQDRINYQGKTLENFIFLKDSNSKHKFSKAPQWFQDHEYEVMLWPSQSTDLNPIEYLWVALKQRLADYKALPREILELWGRVQVEWEKIPPEVCQNLIKSMPEKIAAWIKAKGGCTKY